VEPTSLRRADGSSVYTVVGAELFTSARILDAERRLVATAGRTDGRSVDAVAVDLALLESAPTAQRWTAGRLLWSDAWPPLVPGYNWRSPQPAAEKRPHYARSHRLGWRAAVTCSD